MTINDRIRRMVDEGKFVVVNRWDDPTMTIQYDLRAARGTTIYGTGSDEVFDAVWCYPASLAPSIVEVQEKRAVLKKAYDDSMSLVYELNNRIARGEL